MATGSTGWARNPSFADPKPPGRILRILENSEKRALPDAWEEAGRAEGATPASPPSEMPDPSVAPARPTTCRKGPESLPHYRVVLLTADRRSVVRGTRPSPGRVPDATFRVASPPESTPCRSRTGVFGLRIPYQIGNAYGLSQWTGAESNCRHLDFQCRSLTPMG